MKLKEEPKSKLILTTSYVLTNDSPITFVLYDEDGDWQLFGEDEVSEDEDAYTVSVDEILEMQPILRKLPDMKPGEAVVREADGTRWFIAEEE